jgi:hypothetical protein
MESHSETKAEAGVSSAVDKVQQVIDRIKSDRDMLYQKLKSIEKYDKRESKQYEQLVREIEQFFELCKLEDFKDDQKKQVYEDVFKSLNKSELLCLPQGLRKTNNDPDEDLLLVCASRASRTKSSLFLCDTTFIENIIATNADIPLVNNLGILHHYGISRDETSLAAEVSKAKQFALEKIPVLINERIKNTDLKVVLRCCRGGQNPLDLKSLPSMTVYPFEIFTARAEGEQKEGQSTAERFGSACAKNTKIVIMQQKVLGIEETKIFLPGITECQEPLVRTDFPMLTLTLNEKTKKKPQQPDTAKKLGQAEKKTIEDFSRQLILFLNEQFESHPQTCLYINPFDVSVFGQNPENTGLWSQVKNKVSDCLQAFHKAFECPSSHLEYDPQSSSGLDKKQQQRFFAVANTMKDSTPIPKESYAGELLAKIKVENVAVFKTYCSGYTPYKDRMVTESRRSTETMNPKSITVTGKGGYFDALPVKGADEGSQKSAAGGGPPQKK